MFHDLYILPPSFLHIIPWNQSQLLEQVPQNKMLYVQIYMTERNNI